MNKNYESLKIDIGLVSQALNDTNATGKYHHLKDYRSVLAVLSGGAMAKTKTTKLEVYQAKDAAGTSAKLVTGAAGTITANTLVTELTITLATVLNTETITINDLVFTAHTDTTAAASRQFSIAGTDTQDAAELVTCINDPTYGVPGVTATNAGAVITLVSTDPGATLITAASTDATFTVATTKAQAYVEVESLTLEADFTHVACKITTTANSNVAAVLLRGDARKGITQKASASASV
jgi:hypothetical protein